MEKEQVLRLLMRSSGFVSGEAISKQLGVSRMAVCKAVDALRQEGFVIEAVTRNGYCLRTVSERLSLNGILAYLQEKDAKSALIVLDTVNSTNTYAKQLAAQGTAAGTTVFAAQQTGGRGRMGRQFSSPQGGMYLSMILRPRLAPSQLLHLTAMTAVAACNAIEAVCGLRPGIKWTNDLVFGKKKLGGILTELSIEAESGHIAYCVIGIGINCARCNFPKELDGIVTTLEEVSGKNVCVNALAAALFSELSQLPNALICQKEAWLRQYAADCITVGRDICVISGDTVRHAHADGIGPNAELLVTYENGEHAAVNSGEVSVRGMYGYI